MAIGNSNDLTHIVRTSDQWKNTYDKYELIPVGVLCVELVSSDVTKIKIGDGHNIFSKLPYIGDLDLSKYYTKLETDTRIKEILTQEKVVRIKGIIGSKSDLPADARCGDIYFVRQLSSSDNKYIEYIYSPDNTWEPLGGIPVDIDLSEYAKTAYVDDKIEQVNERIDDIEQHGTHTHPNKEILDQITEPYTTADKETLASLHNYDDTEIREMISQSSHTHANKDILDATSAAFTREDKSKLDQLNPYDDSTIKERITELERVAHEHSNKRILDQTTASFTKEYERKMRWIRMYTGCTGMEEGIAGLVPAAQAGEEDYVLSGSGEWVPQTGGGGTYELPIATASTLGGIKVGDGLEIDANGKLSVVGGGGGGDSIAEGDGITITTDPQTGVKTISVNAGDHLSVDSQTGELNVTGVDYEAGQGIRIGSNYNFLEYIKNSGNYDQIILTDILPKFSDALEVDVMFGAASGLDNNREFIGTCNYDGASTVGDPFFYGIYVFNDNIRTSNITFYNHFVWTPQCTNTNFIDNPYGIDYYGNNPVRQIARMQGNTGSWGNVSRDFSDQYRSDFVDPFYSMAIFGSNHNNSTLAPYICGEITLYGVKLYDSLGTLIHDLRPVERISNGEAGLYDVLTNKFYGNTGNGSFVKGPVITAPDRIINAKIGNGLQFDSNDAIEVNTGDGLSVNASNELEVNIGDGLQINQDGELEIDPSIIPEVMEYSAGEAITIRDVSSTLPAGYVEVDYIEGVGNYTVIDYIPNRKTKIVGTASQTQTSNDPVLFGNRTGSAGQQFVFWFNRYNSTQAKVGFVYGTNTWSTSSDCDNGKLISYTLGDQFTFLISLDDEFNINDSFVHNITENGAPASNLKLGIFALVNTPSDEIESSDQIFRGRMYEFKIYEDDELVVNLIPAISASTNQGGFYDVINDIFYTSKTATPFGYDPSTIHSTGKVIDVNYGNGLVVNQNNELEINTGDGLQINQDGEVEIDPSIIPDSYEAGNGIEITEVTHEDEFRVQNQEYFFTDHGLTCIITGNYGPRTYTKINDGDIVAAVIGTTGGWYMPLFVGLTEDSVKYSNSYDSNILGPTGSFTYHDKTWYYTADYALTAGDGVDHAGHLQSITDTIYTESSKAQAAKDLIDLAVLLPDVSIPTISAKIGAGLSFDANGAIQADAQPLSPATDSTLGGVIVGEGINVDEYGEISLSAGEGLDIDFESHIPSEYTLIKGISSVGHNDLPYINTGYLIKPTSRIVMQGVLYKTTSGWAFPIGVRHNNYSNPVMFCTHHESNGDSIELWLPNDTLIASATDREKCYNDPVTITISGDGLNIENETTGEVVTLTTSDTLPAATLPLYIFATNDNYTLSFPGSMDLYRLQIFEGTTKVLDYLPCKRNSDNKYGVYDIVANEYKASSNAALFEPVTGTPSGDDLIQQIKLLPATENTIGGVIVGDGILVDNNGTISVDPTIIPEVPTYEAGTAISIEDVEHGGVTFDAWDSGTGWENICYSNSTGNSITSYQYEAHSPISNSYTLPAGATHIRAIAYNQNDTMLWTSFSWIDSNDYHFASTSPDDGHYDDWFEIPTGAVKVNFGVRHSKLNNTTAMSLNDIKSVDITIQTVSEIEVDAWNGGTGWLNGDYGSGTSNDFYTNWYYTYHYNYQQYIEVPEGATHVMVKGISNENDSHFEGGGCNAFDSNHNHVYWWSCAWEWQELSSDVKYIQPNVKWDDNNTRTISGSDIKSVTLVWKLPALEINQAINVKYGNGLTVNQNNELEVKLGDGLSIDEDGAIEVTGGGSSGDSIAEGDGITITTDQQTGVKTIGVNVGTGLEIDPNTGALGVAPGVSGNYSAGEAIEFETVTDTHDIVWNMLQMSHTWVNKAYTDHVGGSFENDSLCVHSDITPISNLFSIPQNGTIYTIEARDQNDNLLHCIVDYHDGAGNHLGWNGEFISDPTKQYTSLSSAIYISVGVVNIDHSTPLAISNVKSVTLIWKNVTETSTEISVKYGTGLSIDPITNELFVNGQLPEGTIIKKLTYTGNGSNTNVIQFSKKPLGIISLNGCAGTNWISALPTNINEPYLLSEFGGVSGGSPINAVCNMSFDDTTNQLTLTHSNDAGIAFNASNKNYTMYYLTKGHTGSGTSVNNEVSVIKSFTYVGDGTNPNNIQFPETPDMLVTISAPGGDNTRLSAAPSAMDADKLVIDVSDANNNNGIIGCSMSFNSTTNVLTLSTTKHVSWCLNMSGTTYTVFYAVNEVIPSTMPYAEGDAISIETIGGLQPTNFSNNDFVTSIANINGGTIVKAADNSSFTLTATWDDCYTQGPSLESNGSYPYNVKASTKYRFAWDSANPDKYGMVYVFENGQYGDMMHHVNQHDASYIEFTTTAQTSYIQARFGVDYAGNSITYSNVRLYEVIEDEDQYDEISVKYNKGLSVNQNNELEVNIGTGLSFDPQTGAINVTGGGGGSGDTVAQGAGIEITTDQQTGNKVIAVNAGTGLQVDQTTNELEIDDSVVTEDDELTLVFVPDDYQP